MKLLQINCVYEFGTTGKIVKLIEDTANANGYECFVAYGYGNQIKDEHHYAMQGKIGVYFSLLQTRLFAKHGFYNKIATKKLIKWINNVQPDIVHLHNIHGNYINVKYLFNYLKKINVPVVWTLHDCWSFTGFCDHYIEIECDKWIDGCHNCKNKSAYPKTYFFDRSKEMWNLKKDLFTSIKNMNLISPSLWLSSQVKKSFLKGYPLHTIYNGINIDFYKPTENDLRKKYNISDDDFVILGMASRWFIQKNTQTIKNIADNLGDNKLIIIGANKLPPALEGKAILVPYLNERDEMAKYYTMVDVFVNLSVADTLPTVNTEAMACGTPVITYRNSGCTESVTKETGFVVNNFDYKGIFEAIDVIKSNGKAFYSQSCINYATDVFNMNKTYSKIIDIYNNAIGSEHK